MTTPLRYHKGKSCIAPPILFNGWKHHHEFVVMQIKNWSQKSESSLPLLAAKLQSLGESQFDMYTGVLHPEDIGTEIEEKLNEFKAFSKKNYNRWIDSSNQLFWQINISDGSGWILRKMDDESAPEGYYIHIHPSLHSKHGCRVKANPMRTAITTLIMAAMRGETPSVPMMNGVRKNYLGLSSLTKPLAREIFVTLTHFSKASGLNLHREG